MTKIFACFFVLASGCSSSSTTTTTSDGGAVPPPEEETTDAGGCSIVVTGDVSATYPCMFGVADMAEKENRTSFVLNAMMNGMPPVDGSRASIVIEMPGRLEKKTYAASDLTTGTAQVIPAGADVLTGRYDTRIIESFTVTAFTATGATAEHTAYHVNGSVRAKLVRPDGTGALQLVATF